MNKKLSVAFIWHMHQPSYKDSETDEYLMPWVRLHSVKDYYDMAAILDDFPNIRQTFNIVPSLIDQLNDYGFNNAHDVHSKLSVSPVEELTDSDKAFILDHFFDANYVNMIYPHEPYKILFEKRNNLEERSINSFSLQEYSDIMALFNLVWFDPIWFSKDEKLKKLYEKGNGYTLEDRKYIIETQRSIIRNIIPKYKELFEKGQIEIVTSAYYHALLPVLINSDSAKSASSEVKLPASKWLCKEDAEAQISKGIKQFKEVFGKKPKGIWLPEQGICPEALNLLMDHGIKWTVTDETILSRTLNKKFVRDFHGDLEDPYDLCKAYEYKKEDKKINVLFRNSVIADLISFEYGNHEPDTAANDLYERVKNIQTKLQNTPDKNHVVVIALDGENSWENYKDDGRQFLSNLYTLLSDDKSINVTTVSDFLSKLDNPGRLEDIKTGSWICSNFNVWIGDPIKNKAWDYIYKTREDLISFTKEKKQNKALVEKAWKEIYIAEGSDWFWWYGEPNDSGQDDLFDKLFRAHLQNVYKYFDKPVPEYLLSPLDLYVGKPSKFTTGSISPVINGLIDSEEEWANATCIEIPHTSPVYQPDKFLKKLFFGSDQNNLYLRFDFDEIDFEKNQYEIYIYGFAAERFKMLSPIRLRNKVSATLPVIKYAYAYEVQIPIYKKDKISLTVSEAIDDGLWKLKKSNIISRQKSVFEMAVPFNEIEVFPGQEFHFIIMTSKEQVIQDVIPQNKPLIVTRPLV